MSTAAQFFACNARRIAPIDGLEPWGLTAFVRSITEKERSDFEASWLDRRKQTVDVDRLKLAKSKLIVVCVCDAAGQPLFAKSDIPKLLDLDAALTAVLYNSSRKHAGFDDGDIERLVKNSDGGQDAASPTA